MQLGYLKDTLTKRFDTMSLQADSYEDQCIIEALVYAVQSGATVTIESEDREITFYFFGRPTRDIDCGE